MLKQYEGGYTDYLEANTMKGNDTPSCDKKPAGKDWKKDQPTKLKFSYKEQNEYEAIDEDIAELESKIEGLEQEMLKNATNSAKLSEIMAQKEKAEAALEEKMERWVYLNDLAEKIAAQK